MTTNLTTIDFENKQTIETLINTVAKGATVSEFRMFAEMCKATGLNPYKKEIWCIITGEGQSRKVQMMVGINGFVAIANDQPEYDGMEVIEGDLIEIEAGKNKILVPSFVTAKVYRKDRKFPSVFTAKWSEYSQSLVSKYGNLTVWGQKPGVMLAKCAKSMALREAFPQRLNGLHTEEEFNPENQATEPINITPIVTNRYDTKRRIEPNFEGFYRYKFPAEMEQAQHDWIRNNVMILDHRIIDQEAGIVEFPEALVPQLNKFYMGLSNE